MLEYLSVRDLAPLRVLRSEKCSEHRLVHPLERLLGCELAPVLESQMAQRLENGLVLL